MSFAEKLYEINNAACGFYGENIKTPAGEEARRYFAKRGIDERTIKDFRLGFAVGAWQGLIDYLRPKGVNPEFLEKAGLVLKNHTTDFAIVLSFRYLT